MKALLEKLANDAQTINDSNIDPTAKATAQVKTQVNTRSTLKAEERQPLFEKLNNRINEIVDNATNLVRSALFPNQLVPAYS